MENIEPLGWIIIIVWGLWIARVIHLNIKKIVVLRRENKALEKQLKELDAGRN